MNNELAQLREARGWSQGDLAEKLDVSRQTVNALERGRYDPSLTLAFKIASLFRCRIEDVFSPDAGGTTHEAIKPGAASRSDERRPARK